MIAICPNPFRDAGLQLTREAMRLLNEAGFDTVVCPLFAEDEPGIVPDDIKTRELKDVAKDCQMIVVIGGDGTILAAVRAARDYSPLILGVNLGTKGFMASLEAEDLPLIVKAARSEAAISRRMMLDIELIRDGKVIYTDRALNDAVIHGYGDCVKLTAMCDMNVISTFSGDGIVISTPTGSTGYSMSAGGPIIEPEAENLIITPICAHMMGARSFVLAPTKTVEVTTFKLHHRKAYLSVDGNSVYDMANKDLLIVRRSAQYTNMADLGLKSFYDTAYEKLN